MAKDKQPLFTPETDHGTDTARMSGEHAETVSRPGDALDALDALAYGFLIHGFPRESSDVAITQILENNVGYLDSLRRSLETTNNKAIPDVRMYGDTMASSLLSGFEGTVTYGNLVDIINDMKTGIARRRVALAEPS